LFYTLHLGAPTAGARKTMLFVQTKNNNSLFFGTFCPFFAFKRRLHDHQQNSSKSFITQRFTRSLKMMTHP
ncbi:MAG: hypothetical protein VW707_03955, partial [Candidatus Puniceispirillum sp.]